MQTVAAHMIYLPVEPVDAKKGRETEREKEKHVTTDIQYCHPGLSFEL